MTIIVGVVSDGHVYLGADSRGTHDCLSRPFIHPKAWAQSGLVLGLTGRVREQQIIQYCTSLPSPPEGDADLMRWLCSTFIDAIREARKSAGYDERIDGQGQCEYGPVLMVGVRGRLFVLHGDYSVAEYLDAAAIGSGETAAWGSLRTTETLKLQDPKERLLLALEAACAHNVYCGPPYSFASTRTE